jgi:flagellar protein FliO/FliZ
MVTLPVPVSIFSQTATEAAATNESGTDSSAAAAERAIEIRQAESEFAIGDEGAAAGGDTVGIGAIFRMVLVLALVAAAIYLVIFFLRRASRPQAEQNPHLKILASTHLGSGRYVYVVSVGSEAWLVGAGEGGVTRIADITDHEAIDAMILDASQKAAEQGPVSPFLALLKKFSPGAGEPSVNRLNKLKERRERFKRL